MKNNNYECGQQKSCSKLNIALTPWTPDVSLKPQILSKLE